VKELYYLPDDIDENENLYSLYPDVVERLGEATRAFDRELSANARPVGNAADVEDDQSQPGM
jgi:hypothetical protein